MASIGFNSTANPYQKPKPAQQYDPASGTWTTNVGSQSSWQTYAPQGNMAQPPGGSKPPSGGGYGYQDPTYPNVTGHLTPQAGGGYGYTPGPYQQNPDAGNGGGQQQPSQGGFFSGNVQQGVQDLGFGQAPTPYGVPQLGPLDTSGMGNVQINTSGMSVQAPGAINAPHVQAEQGGFQNFDELQNSLYHSQFDPTQRELGRQQGLADQRLAAQLAQAGIADSGAGVGQRTAQSAEYDRQVAAAAQDSASKAAAQRYGYEYQQSMENAKMRQETNLANAGFDMQAQVETAHNFLTASVATAQNRTQAAIAQGQITSQGQIAALQAKNQRDIAQGQMYLDTMGLNYQQERGARQDFLSLMGLQEQDLGRMDAYSLENLSLYYNTWIKQFSAITQAGEQQTGKTDQSSSSTGVDVGFGV